MHRQRAAAGREGAFSMFHGSITATWRVSQPALSQGASCEAPAGSIINSFQSIFLIARE